jgi:pimeloyl-ACP methyl ester carboxylesterase
MHAYAIALERNALAGIEKTLRGNRAPVGVVWGMADTIFSKDSPDYLARVMGGLRWVRRLPEAKLFWPEEHPDIVAQAARDLWASYA